MDTFTHVKTEAKFELVNVIPKIRNEETNYGHSTTNDIKETTPATTCSIWFCCEDSSTDTESEDDAISSSNLLDDSFSSSVNTSGNHLVIKKPIRKASSWNISKSHSTGNSTASAENAVEAEVSVHKRTEKDTLSGKFSLFPASTDTDPMCSIRKDLSTTSSTDFGMSSSTNTNFTSGGVKILSQEIAFSRAQNEKTESPTATVDKIIFDDSSKSNPSERLSKKTCFETTFKNLSLDSFTILPSI